MGHFSCVGFGFAKALIFGEYAVMYGAPGLVMALAPQCTVHVYDAHDANAGGIGADSGPFPLSPFPVGAGGTRPLQGDPFPVGAGGTRPLQGGIGAGSGSDGTRDAALERALRERYGIHACVSVSRGDFFDASGHKLGIGSSAAAAAGLVDAVRRLPAPLRCDTTLSDAIAIHREMQGRMGSGIDVIAAAMGGVLCAHGCPHAPVVRRIPTENLPRIAILATHRSAPTADFLAAARRVENSREYRACIDALTQAYADLERCLDAPQNKRDFLEQIGRLPALLRRIGNAIDRPVVPPEFDALLPAARECGVALKTSGAGGGDILLAMAETDDAIREFCARVPEGISPLPNPIAPERDLA